jgi:hypothetical protein
MSSEDSIQSRGGKARAESLTPDERKQIARAAAQARWDNDGATNASHDGDLNIGGKQIKAAVLPNGKRLLTQGTFLLALGRSRTPKAGTGGSGSVDGLPFFLAAEQLKPFISEELRLSTTPIIFRLKTGQKAVGYDANLLPMVCEVYLKLRDSFAAEGKKVPVQYKHIIEACDLLVRGLARVGIAALVDEATGYQHERDRNALQAILDKYLRKEFAAWAKTFPDEFYREIFRIRGWAWKGMRVNRPQVVAHYTKDLIYSRLAPGILTELEKRNPSDTDGKRRGRHFQLLTDDIGVPALAQHLYGVIGMMRASDNWDAMMKMVNRAYPKRGDTIQVEMEFPTLQ